MPLPRCRALLQPRTAGSVHFARPKHRGVGGIARRWRRHVGYGHAAPLAPRVFGRKRRCTAAQGGRRLWHRVVTAYRMRILWAVRCDRTRVQLNACERVRILEGGGVRGDRGFVPLCRAPSRRLRNPGQRTSCWLPAAGHVESFAQFRCNEAILHVRCHHRLREVVVLNATLTIRLSGRTTKAAGWVWVWESGRGGRDGEVKWLGC